MFAQVQKREGFILPAVILFIIFSIGMGMAVLEFGVIENRQARRRGEREERFYLAEGGVERAVAHIRADNEWQPETYARPLGNGYYHVIRYDEGNRMHIYSRGITDSRYDADAEYEEAGPGDFDWDVRVTLRRVHVWGEKGVFGRDSVFLGNRASIASYDSTNWFPDDFGDEGHTGSILGILFHSQAEGIFGNASVAVGGDPIDEDYVTGLVNNEAAFPDSLTDMEDVQIPASLTALSYPDPEDNPITVLEGTFLLDDDGALLLDGSSIALIPSGDYRFSSIDLRGGSKLVFEDNTNLYVEEKVDMRGNPTWEMQGQTVLYMGADSTVTLDGDVTVWHEVTTKEGESVQSIDPIGLQIYSASTRDDAIKLDNSPDKGGIIGTVGLIYAPLGGVFLSNNTDFYGAIVARMVDIGNNSNLYYDINLRDTDIDLAPTTLETERWTKPGWADRFALP